LRSLPRGERLGDRCGRCLLGCVTTFANPKGLRPVGLQAMKGYGAESWQDSVFFCVLKRHRPAWRMQNRLGSAFEPPVDEPGPCTSGTWGRQRRRPLPEESNPLLSGGGANLSPGTQKNGRRGWLTREPVSLSMGGSVPNLIDALYREGRLCPGMCLPLQGV